MKNATKTILITGGSSGIGAALAHAYAENGNVRLLLTGRDQSRLSAVAAACTLKGALVETAVVDVTDKDALRAKLLAWDDAFAIDIAIANAGISGGAGISDEKEFREIMATNVDGTFNTVFPVMPRMVARQSGQIALMSSMAGWRGLPNAPAYSTSKVAVRAYGEAMRPVLKQSGVKLSVIFPGFVETPLTAVNKFKMPFLMTVDKAAKIIKRGLDADKARIAFPLRMLLLIRFITALPLCLGDFILSKGPKKG